MTPNEEYDGFGPWILPVRTADDVPPLFRPRNLDPAGAHMALKVPRSIERRDASPGMDLYDHLLLLDQDSLTVLSRDTGFSGRGFTERRVLLTELAGIRDSVDLLAGRLVVATRDGAVLELTYNGSASDTVGRLVAALQEGFPTVGAGASGDTASAGVLGRDDVDLVGLLRDTRSGGGKLLLAQPRRRVHPTSGPLARVAHLLSPATLHATLVCRGPRSVDVLGRAVPLARGRTPVRSLDRLSLPAAGVQLIEAGPRRGYAGVTDVVLGVGAARFVVPLNCDRDAAARLADALSRSTADTASE